MRYYGMSLDDIGKLTMIQFNMLLSNISEIEKLFNGSDSSPRPATNQELIEEAKRYGLKGPRGK